ncbi:MAG: Putative oxidoreducatse SCO7286 [uncultured Rubrobacteraceae bacterium]|uniref:Oxidoreducatse SCO7286 n=1 Tax=uncultured Rubrobacteraceae bacterium TaxID=349277 RepID=A0A6J4RDF9_9ACTN|nr:MAG: Putative oxidoreducatse SCO7286 [uncultured Rubrobacteraceae bacterium]
MEYRDLGQTGMRVSEISLGTWAFGDGWGTVGEDDALGALNRAVDLGVNFLDTADVYGDGRSEKLIGRLLKDRPNDEVLVASKAGRRLDPHTPEGYDYDNLSAFVERSLKNLGVEALDLLQLHCPPTEVYRQDSTFEALDRLQEAGKVRNYGVSVEKVEEARMVLDYPGVATVQIIFNVFRQKPAEVFFPLAEERNVGILARVPLASGLLSGKMRADRVFGEDDHRNFNREGQAFDRGETFSGVDFETGLRAAEELKDLVPEGNTLAQFALRWILMHPAVSCAIPGGKNPSQVEDNIAAAEMPPLTDEVMQRAREIYDSHVRDEVHHRW